ncbi:MAG TPA: hypothetical protein VFR94_11030 [Nitrososphaeraceae archaeon]|nr:hypothetical protein [Nitrososphaeraceae archaeon]
MKNNTILAIIAILVGATTLATTGSTIVPSALAQATDNATMGNMTGGNMTMGTDNATAGNMTEAVGQISGGGGRCGGTCYSDTD